jgi:hypothetical protein
LKGNLILNSDSILVYGNIGVWLTDSAFKHYESWNSGFPQGIDNRKIFDIVQTENGEIYAATLVGLYAWDHDSKKWVILNTGGEVTLFQTIWQIHSGEIMGLPGQVFVDILGIITAFLSITGILYFFFPGWIKSRGQRKKILSRWSASINGHLNGIINWGHGPLSC